MSSANIAQYVATTAAGGTAQPLGVRMMAVEPVTSLDATGIRAVLAWGKQPSDLDFHVYLDSGSNASCLTCGAGRGARVCTNAPPVYYSNPEAFGGASLDVDDTSSFGPETMTFVDSAYDGLYHLVIHVYNSHTSLRNSEAEVMVSMRGVTHLVTIRPTPQVAASACDRENCAGSNCCYWWVGSIRKEGSTYEYVSTNVVIQKPSSC